MTKTPKNPPTIFIEQYDAIARCEVLLDDFINLYTSLRQSKEIRSGIVKFRTAEEVCELIRQSIDSGVE